MSTKKKTTTKAKNTPEFADCTAPDDVLNNFRITTQREWRRIKRRELPRPIPCLSS